jgi:hypothetical protein
MPLWFELGILTSSAGRLYDEALQRWLGPLSADRSTLERLAHSPDWRPAVTAKILLGWIDRGPEYRELLAMMDSENVEAAGRMVAGLHPILLKYRNLAATKYGPGVLPLCWEASLKHAEEWPHWKVVAFFRMMEAVPHPDSLEPLLWFLETTRDDALAHSAGKALAQLPRESVEPRLAELTASGARLRVRAEGVAREIRGVIRPLR